MSEKKAKLKSVEQIKAIRQNRNTGNAPTPEKLKLLILIVNKRKAEFYTDFLQQFDVNLQLAVPAEGTADKETLSILDLVEEEKEVIMATVREKMAPEVLSRLNEKFATIKNGKGIAFTVPYSGVVGLNVYRFLSNNRTNYGG